MFLTLASYVMYSILLVGVIPTPASGPEELDACIERGDVVMGLYSLDEEKNFVKEFYCVPAELPTEEPAETHEHNAQQ